jgi:hypothetical protein
MLVVLGRAAFDILLPEREVYCVLTLRVFPRTEYDASPLLYASRVLKNFSISLMVFSPSSEITFSNVDLTSALSGIKLAACLSAS